MSILGCRLRQARKYKGLTQDNAAKIIGTTYQTISNYERGTRDPDTETLVKLANLYNTSIDYLVGNTDDPTPLQAKKEEPSHENYVLAANTLADATIRIANLFNTGQIDENTFYDLAKKAYDKFGLPGAQTSEDAAHNKKGNIPGTGVFGEKYGEGPEKP